MNHLRQALPHVLPFIQLIATLIVAISLEFGLPLLLAVMSDPHWPPFSFVVIYPCFLPLTLGALAGGIFLMHDPQNHPFAWGLLLSVPIVWTAAFLQSFSCPAGHPPGMKMWYPPCVGGRKRTV